MPGTLNALSSPSNGNKGVGQPSSESPPVDSRDAAMSPVFEIALGRFTKSECSPDELPPLIETIFERSDLTDTILCLSKDDAQAFIDAADETLGRFDLPSRTRVNCLRQLYKTCSHYKLIPRSLEVSICYDRDGGPEYSGGYADVYKRQHCGKEVAVKVIRTCSKSDLRKVFAMFCKEFVAWKTLRHPHVLPLIGVNTSGAHFVMVSEWMNNGNIKEFVEANPDINRLKLLGGVAKGLIYIHQQRVIHGDLKGANILIDQTGNALLADFGLLTIISNTASLFHSSSHAQGGTVRWMSPELIAPQKYGLEASSPTVPSDCYAFGMVIYEIISGNPPFHKDKLDCAVMLKVLDGELPDRGTEFTDGLWTMLERCWAPSAGERPGVEEILRCLDTYSNLSVPPSPPGMDIVWESGSVPVSYPPAIPDSQHHTTTGTLGDISEDQAVGASYPPPGRDPEIEARGLILDVANPPPYRPKQGPAPYERRGGKKRKRRGNSRDPVPMELIPADLSKPLGRPDFIAVCQTKYYCGTVLGNRKLMPPINFTVQNKEGIRLIDAMNMHFSYLDGCDDPMFVEGGVGPAVSLRIEFVGYQSGSIQARRILTMNHKKNRGPITRQKLGHEVAKTIKLHLEEGGPFPVPFEDMYLVGLHHVSLASWQPELWCEASTTSQSGPYVRSFVSSVDDMSLCISKPLEAPSM